MSFKSNDDRIPHYSSEHYDIIGSDLDWFIILAAASSIFFGFLLKIAENPPSYFTVFDNYVLLAALYAVTVATAMFMQPVIDHARHYQRLDVERFLFKSRKPVRIGIICVTLAMYLGLGLALNSKLPVHIAYILATLTPIFIFFEFFRSKHRYK